MTKKKYLSLYYEWMEKQMLPNRNGLCNEFGIWSPEKGGSFDFDNHPLFKLMTPEVYRGGPTRLWGGETEWQFTPLRQNIVLLMACMAEEY